MHDVVGIAMHPSPQWRGGGSKYNMKGNIPRKLLHFIIGSFATRNIIDKCIGSVVHGASFVVRSVQYSHFYGNSLEKN